MNAQPLALPEVLCITPKVFADGRGFFFESFNQRSFEAATGLAQSFVQDNHSRSVKGVLRGLHFQRPPHAQGKLVRVVQGAVFDVAVDVRKSSPRFGKWVALELSAENKHQVWIPPGFAHGFLTLTDTAEVIYKTTDFYAPASEGCIAWDDPALGITWPDVGVAPTLSAKDQLGVPLRQALVFD
jgi:dTDP-4-dehydrorhamnose 3,5-epimerase